MVRQEDGTKIHQQRKESQETQAEDDGMSVTAGGRGLTSDQSGQEEDTCLCQGAGPGPGSLALLPLLPASSDSAAQAPGVSIHVSVAVECFLGVLSINNANA